MSRHRFILSAAPAMATVLFIGTVATGADMHEPFHGRRPNQTRNVESMAIMELQPGMVKILNVKPELYVQSIAVGNPNVVDATAINLNAIALTGKGVGLTNVVLFDGEGRKISDISIQVVTASVYQTGGFFQAAREIRVVRLWNGPSPQSQGSGSIQVPKERRYLCAPACSYIAVDEPPEFNPPGNASAPVATKAEGLYPTFQGPPGAPGAALQAPAPANPRGGF